MRGAKKIISDVWNWFWLKVGIHRFWLVGPLWIVVNGYVRRGDDASLWLPASPLRYFSRIFLRPMLCIFLVWLYFHFGDKFNFLDFSKTASVDPFSLIESVFPNILGFGMGVYALMFALPRDFVVMLNSEHEKKRRRIGAEGLNSIMAYPLCAYAVMIAFAPLFSFINIPSCYSKIIGFGLYVYGMYLSVELVCVIYLAARRSVKTANTD